jgi:hypothetical protein
MTSVLKSIRFNLDDEEDRKLYEWLSHLKRGEFTELTKQFWMDKMEQIERVRDGYKLPESLMNDLKKMKEDQ